MSRVANKLADFANVEWVVVTLGLGLRVNLVWVLPCLHQRLASSNPASSVPWSYLGESTIVPEITLVREAVAHKSKLALLGILENRVELLLLGDLHKVV